MFRKWKTQAKKISELEEELAFVKKQIESQQKTFYDTRMALAQERMNRKAVIAFIEKASTKVTRPDGTTTITLTSFVDNLNNLFISKENLGIKESP